MSSIYQQLKAAGVPLDHHESDLYAKQTPESKSIVGAYEHRCNVQAFRSDGEWWYDIPFAYEPFWDRVEGLARKNDALWLADHCDGEGPHGGLAIVKRYPLGGGGAAILCRSCWEHENGYRVERGSEPGQSHENWPQENWAHAEAYAAQCCGD